ncbi:MAG: NusG domain II-containing protein, partial [Lachnospiraceae bacterium]|nr:NusG domain II-containing protein [Lachnospiraceae bacterium]
IINNRINVRKYMFDNKKEEFMFRKKDFVLVLVLVGIAVFSALMISFARKDIGGTIRITIDGALYGEYSLSENQVIEIDELLGYNEIKIENGSAYMAEADCPDQYCMDYKPISKGSETIICLPHRLVIEVTGEKALQQPDVIVP